MREIILDTETTGLDPLRGDRLVEIGAGRDRDAPDFLFVDRIDDRQGLSVRTPSPFSGDEELSIAIHVFSYSLGID